jgi:predicted Zn finger-like uncharacterized protein
MRIVCPHCSTSYEVDNAQLGAEGRTVRCARCQQTWRAKAPAHALVAEPLEWGLAALEPKDAVAHPVWESPAVTAESYGPNLPASIADAPPLSPADHDEPPHEWTHAAEIVSETEPREDIETVAARRAHVARDTRRRKRQRSGPLRVIAACAAVLAALLIWRAEVVRLAPQTAQIFAAIGLPVNLRGVAFEDLGITEETHEGVPVMVVQGRIVNITKHDAEVPRLRFAVRNKAGVEIYAWTALPDQNELKAGESMPFRSRLASPPAESKDVLVRFFQRRDLVGTP